MSIASDIYDHYVRKLGTYDRGLIAKHMARHARLIQTLDPTHAAEVVGFRIPAKFVSRAGEWRLRNGR